MKKSLFSLLLGCACSFFTSQGECSNTLSKKIIEKLHRTSHKPPVRRVKQVDQKTGIVYVKDEPLNPENLDTLKKNSFTPPKKTAVRADSDTDIIYFKKEE